MNKFLKAIMCAGLCGTMAFAVACNPDNNNDTPNPDTGKTQQHDPETRPLYLSIGAVDGNFNPFFYTSLTDGQVVSMTQSALITTEVVKNSKGDDEVIPVAGEDYPTIAKDFTTRYFRADGSETNNSAEAAEGGTTEYEFLIKKGMKYSDGSEISIKDVLFNFYVYLDPSYTGSNTMYSVDIQGLLAYQENDSNLKDGDSSGSAEDAANAQARINKIVDWSNHEEGITQESIQADLDVVYELFKEELNSDWTSNSTSWAVNYETNYNFKYAWQAFLFMEGEISVQQEDDGTGRIYDIRVDENNNKLDPASEEYKTGKNLTTLDPWHEDCNVNANKDVNIGAYDIIDAIEAATEGLVNEDGTIKEGKELQYEEATKTYCINRLFDNNTDQNSIKYVVLYWGTARTAYSYFVADEHGKRTSGSTTPQYYIEGLQTRKTTTFNGKDLGEEYDVFKIVINEVDPAAIWQFGVSIAPLYYYSGTWNGKNYVTSFNGHLNGGKGPGDATTCFGLERDSVDFLNAVIKDTTKSGVPKGAGAYMAATENGTEAKNRSQFENGGQINYVRNSYFETMGEGIENAKIRTLRYSVIDEDKIIASLNAGSIDYGEPNATPTNMTSITTGTSAQTLGYATYRTNGYGYVGINAGKVPDVNVRRVIMSVMNTSEALRYYGANLATTIYRSLSATSWAYPSNVRGLPNYIYEASKTSDSEEIKAYLLANGYEMKNGVLTNKETNETLTYTFTIAGANSDHPAYTMFKKAEEILNAAGFKITVSTDPNALMQLTRGGLAVWAAAWSAGVDPDMYQVWHMDSNATSVLNWGYDVIKQDTQKYAYEWGLIQDLSAKIEEARSTDDKNERTEMYGECLEMVMELSVELPIYQRNDLCVYNKTVIDATTLNQSPNCYLSLINNIWEVNYL